jgi:hypothetical protein
VKVLRNARLLSCSLDGDELSTSLTAVAASIFGSRSIVIDAVRIVKFRKGALAGIVVIYALPIAQATCGAFLSELHC